MQHPFLESLLAQLNAAIDRHNAMLDRKVEYGLLEPYDAATRKLRPGQMTLELVREEHWPDRLMKAVGGLLTQEHPDAILGWIRLVKEPTQKTKDIGHGCLRARRPPDKEQLPVAVRTIDMAHILARVDIQAR